MSKPISVPVLVIHGGAGAIPEHGTTPELQRQYEDALRAILQQASAGLFQGGSALDAVTRAVQLLEDCPLFNAGYGAVFTRDSTHELDAAIMDSNHAGAVAMVSHLRNPILAARAVMEYSEHILLVGENAERFAIAHGAQQVSNDYFSTESRRAQLHLLQANPVTAQQMALDHDQVQAPLDEHSKMGTVGAVALDSLGHLAAATSTGGMTNKLPGRVGDSPIIGAGCYANTTCAVSCTGTGEDFMRLVVARDVAAQMEYANKSLQQATEDLIYNKLSAIGGYGGLIAVDHLGQVAMPFNTNGMYRGVIYPNTAAWIGIYE